MGSGGTLLLPQAIEFTCLQNEQIHRVQFPKTDTRITETV